MPPVMPAPARTHAETTYVSFPSNSERYNLIVLKDLKIRNMTRSTKSTPDVPRTNVAAKEQVE